MIDFHRSNRRLPASDFPGAWLPVLVLGCCLTGGGCQPATESSPSTPPAAEAAAPAESDAASTPSENAGAATPRPPAEPVGDDPSASLSRLAERVRGAFESFDRTQELIFPDGFHRERAEVHEVTSELVPSEPGAAGGSETRGRVRVKWRELYSVIHYQRDEATADPNLYPRQPKATLEAMQNNAFNPEFKPQEFEIEYVARDGAWVRTEWTGITRRTKGADFLDVVGVP